MLVQWLHQKASQNSLKGGGYFGRPKLPPLYHSISKQGCGPINPNPWITDEMAKYPIEKNQTQ
jgi:hypothetical protein